MKNTKHTNTEINTIKRRLRNNFSNDDGGHAPVSPYGYPWHIVVYCDQVSLLSTVCIYRNSSFMSIYQRSHGWETLRKSVPAKVKGLNEILQSVHHLVMVCLSVCLCEMNAFRASYTTRMYRHSDQSSSSSSSEQQQQQQRHFHALWVTWLMTSSSFNSSQSYARRLLYITADSGTMGTGRQTDREKAGQRDSRTHGRALHVIWHSMPWRSLLTNHSHLYDSIWIFIKHGD